MLQLTTASPPDTTLTQGAAFDQTKSIVSVLPPTKMNEACLARELYDRWLQNHPSAISQFSSISERLVKKQVVLFLDYDGTLANIVKNPDRAFMTEEMRQTVRDISKMFRTAIITGRTVEKVEKFVQLETLSYAGSHGFDIRAPAGHESVQPAAGLRPLFDKVFDHMKNAVSHIPGAFVEHNTFCVTVHFRNCKESFYDEIKTAVEKAVSKEPDLKIKTGRKVFNVLPTMEWGKGHAVEHFLKMWKCMGDDVVPIYLGDDVTDEDAFRAVKKWPGNGLGILVSSKAKESDAEYSVRNPSEVSEFLQKLLEWKKEHILSASVRTHQ